MKKLIPLVIMCAVGLLSGCTEPVPPGYLGKVVTADGVAPEQYGVGRAPAWGRDRLVLIETSSVLRPANVRVIMADRQSFKSSDSDEMQAQSIGLAMDFIVNIRYRIGTDNKDAINALLQDMSLSANVKEIQGELVYEKYGDMVVGRVAREVLGKYTPEEVLGNLVEINQILDSRIKKSLANSPLEISSVSLGPISLPQLITDRIDKNKETELSEYDNEPSRK